MNSSIVLISVINVLMKKRSIIHSFISDYIFLGTQFLHSKNSLKMPPATIIIIFLFQGKTTIVQNDSWTYCALVPATIVGNELVNGSQFGLGPENDMMTMYNTAFSMSQEEYRILTVCIYEVGKKEKLMDK